ncbi:hypothetical protein [Ectobacillus ponti]|uniref:Uncharacterized protein n=1 Tax=Ectobacillus ponti TaxID=2961894 RepID=A0AA41XAQ0_9BACI|nr:hypothetical protein [Ectobacillus ponti]MCP8969383.1 hypothetical protein [Ectobacillus ponti]
MSATTWLVVSVAGYALAGILFAAAVFMFFKMNIWAVIGDVTGRTAAKQIQQIRELNQRTGEKRHRPDVFNVERGPLTTPVSRTIRTAFGASKRLKGKTEETPPPVMMNRVQAEREIHVPQSHFAEPDTTVLSEETAVLPEETTVLFEDTAVLAEETTVLTEEPQSGTSAAVSDYGTEVLLQDEGTTVLGATSELSPEPEGEPQAVAFKIVKNIKIVHTSEVI